MPSGCCSAASGEAEAALQASWPDYTKMHFAREEQFFAQTARADAPAHKKEHEERTKQVASVQTKYKAGATSTLSLEVMNFLKNWLISHIPGSDKKYGPHLNAKGVK